MLIAGYGRVSTAKDAQLDSLENQIEFFSQYAAAHNYEVYRIYADEGISGKQMKNRKEFLQMIQDAKLHRFDLVVVKDISRFARNTVDLLTATRELRAAGIEVQFLSNNQTILGNSEFVLTVFGALAQEESASLSKRVKFGKKINAQKGRVPNRIYGYRQIDTFHLEVVGEEAETIRRIFALYVDQGLGVRRICAALNEQGRRTREGALWRPTTLRRMLANPIYCGVLETHKWDTVDFISGKRRELDREERFYLERPEWALVTKEQWERAQEISRERAAQSGAAAKSASNGLRERYSSTHLFSTLIRCEECGYSFSRKHWSTRKSGTVYYWTCSGRNNFTSSFCPNGTALKETALTDALRQYFLQAAGDTEKFLRKVRNAVEEMLNTVAAGEESAAETEKKRTALERRASRYKEMYANDLLTLEELKRSLEVVRERVLELPDHGPDQPAETERKEARRRALDEIVTLDHLLDLSRWTNSNLRRIVERITVGAGGETVVQLQELSRRY